MNSTLTAAKGSAHGRSKLTEEDVRWVRKNHRYSGGIYNTPEMSYILEVTQSAIRRIINRESWRHLEQA